MVVAIISQAESAGGKGGRHTDEKIKTEREKEKGEITENQEEGKRKVELH